MSNPNPNSLSNASKDMKKCSGFEFDNLPKGIFRKIMVLLPIGSLMRCKCLNKSWYFDICYLIKDPEFVADNTRFSKASPTILLFCRRGSPLVLSMYNVQLTDNGNAFGEIQCVTQEFSFPPSLEGFHERVFCHCNGLICFSDDGKVIIIGNPALCEYETLRPKTSLTKMTLRGMGFGCDSEARNYKVVRLLGYKSAQVFTLGGAYSWRTLNINNDGPWLITRHYAYSNGRCFWLTLQIPQNTVLCFDFSTETFHTIYLEENVESDRWGLTVRNDCVRLVAFDPGKTLCRVAVVKETGFRPRYIGYFFSNWTIFSRDISLSCWKSKELLIWSVNSYNGNQWHEISSFNLEIHKLRKLSIAEQLFNIYYCGPYEMSLLSVKQMMNRPWRTELWNPGSELVVFRHQGRS